MIAAVRATGIRRHDNRELATFRLTVAPRMWRLSRRRNSRIFQDRFVHEIISAVLCEHRVPHRFVLNSAYPRRVYCTQFEETDLELVTRLLAEEGIFFFFEHRDEFAGGTLQPPPEPVPIGWTDPRDATNAQHWENVKYLTKQGGDWLRENAAGIRSVLGTAAGGGVRALGDLIDAGFIKPERIDTISGVSGEAGPAGAGEVLVFVDSPGLYARSKRRAGSQENLTLEIADEAGLKGEAEQIRELARTEVVSSTAAEVRDYDFRRPLLELKKSNAGEISEPSRLEVYTHHGEHETPDVNDEAVRVVLEQNRAEALSFQGRGSSPRLMAGHVFTLADPRGNRKCEGDYAIVRVHHRSRDPQRHDGADGQVDGIAEGCAEAIRRALRIGAPVHERALASIVRDALDTGDVGLSYDNRFECVPHDQAYRPAAPKRVMRTVVESATVVGPPGHEIYTDPYGRIKVQFHWDREHAFQGDSSCWIRVLHPWAGAGWGFQFIPRVGMEVLVSFLGGDPDRPVVLGSLYNQTHPTPEPLPRSQTRSGLRTQSTPGGAGFNEITFEDAKGMERIYLRGHRDIEVISGREHATFVGANQTLAVKDDQRASIAGDQLTAVGRNHGLMVGGHQLENVAGNRGARVECSQLGIVEGDDVAEVDGVSVRAVRGDAVSHVAGHQSASVGGDSFVHVGSGASGRAGSLVAHVQGGSYLTAGEKIVIRAAGAKGEPGAAIVLECGTSTIEMTPDTIVLRADNVIVEGGKRTAVTGGDGRFDMNGANSELSNAEVKMRSTAGARLDLGDGATLGGARVSLTGPAGAARQEAERQNTAASKVTFALVHGKPRNAKPIAGTRYRVLVGDEPPQEGRTDADGKVSFHAPEDATAATVLAWAHETYPTLYPKSRGPLEWLIHLVPGQLPGAGDLRGARMRLRNLGYRPSTELYQPLDEATTQAVREFQQAYQFSMHTEQHKARHAKDDDKDEARLVSKRKLRPSGELDDHTKTALETICGK